MVWRLKGGPHGEAIGTPVGETCDRFDRHCSTALVHDAQVGALIGPFEFALEVVEHRHHGDDVRTVPGEEHGGIAGGRFVDGGGHRQRLVPDVDCGGGVGGDVTIVSHHHGNRLTDKAHDIARQCGPLEPGQTAGKIGVVDEVGSREHAEHTFDGERGADIDMRDPRMGLCRSHEHRECAVGGRQIVDESTRSREQAWIFFPENSCANQTHREPPSGMQWCCVLLMA